jgi:hypothetical protein
VSVVVAAQRRRQPMRGPAHADTSYTAVRIVQVHWPREVLRTKSGLPQELVLPLRRHDVQAA